MHRLSHHGERSALMWDVGDWLLNGEDSVLKHKKKSAIRELACKLTGYSKHTLTMAVSVSRKVQPSIRIDGLSWWHHLSVSHLHPDHQVEWLTRAAESEWSVVRLRGELRAVDTIGSSATKPKLQASDRVVKQLIQLSRDQISTSSLADLVAWWQREIALGDSETVTIQPDLVDAAEH